MTSARIPALRNQPMISIGLGVAALLAAWAVGNWIAAEDLITLIFAVIAFAVLFVVSIILRNWRLGFYLFLVWLMFEDLIRKYLGNSMVIYFGKDVLALITVLSLVVAIRRKREPAFRPPFMIFLSLFFWLGVLQAFNPHAPSVFYGLLGLKLYFSYIPLLFVGYALIRNDQDLNSFLKVNMSLAGVISLVGIIQAIVGKGFLNPAVLAPEIRDLSTLERAAPLTGALFYRPNSIFVSDGRFASYLLLCWIMALGGMGYLLLRGHGSRKLVLLSTGLVAAALVTSGSRGSFVTAGGSMLVMIVAFLWGAPWRQGRVLRVVRALRRSVIIAGIALAIVVFFFPQALGSRWAFYVETMSPESSASELGNRVENYPAQEFLKAFSQPNWQWGNGIGTASLGVQYLSKQLGQRPPQIGVESGYGTLILELGVLGLALWLVWTTAVIIMSWRVVRRLRKTRLFPLGFAVFWFAAVLLFPFSYAGMAPYQNYVYNVFLWLLLGVLFRLPELARDQTSQIYDVASEGSKLCFQNNSGFAVGGSGGQ